MEHDATILFGGSSIFDVIDLVESGCSRRQLGGAVEHDPRVVVVLVAVPPICSLEVLAGQVRASDLALVTRVVTNTSIGSHQRSRWPVAHSLGTIGQQPVLPGPGQMLGSGRCRCPF